jgi:hypothetical protein
MIRLMENPATFREGVLGRGVYGGADALRLINFRRNPETPGRPVSRHTVARWLRGYDYKDRSGEIRHSAPLWRPDYADDDAIEAAKLYEVPLSAVREAVTFQRQLAA